MRKQGVFLICLFAVACLAAEPLRVACVGDSITYGATISNRANNSYPAQMSRMPDSEWAVQNFGVSGATLLKKGDKPYWKTSAFRAAGEFEPDIVIIKLGTNDTKPQNWEHRREFIDDYVKLIRHFQTLESAPRVWVCTPVPVFANRWKIADEVIRNEMIPMINQAVRQTGVPIIDLYTALNGKKEQFPDGVHPNADGAKLIAKAVFQAIQQ